MKLPILIVTLIFCAYCANDSLTTGVYHVTTSLVLKTTDKKAAQAQLSSKIENMDGWLLTANLDEIRFRLPQDSVKHFLGMVDSMGITTDKNYSRIDVTYDYMKLTASLQAKSSLLKQYFDILDSSGTQGIYAVSREIADLQNNIELLKGQIMGMVERMDYAEIRISFNFTDRRVPLVSGHSDFEWLNTVNLPGLLEEFR
jgi:hypothetical protein